MILNTACIVDSATLIVKQTHPVLASGKPYCKKVGHCLDKLMAQAVDQRMINIDQLKAEAFVCSRTCT